MERKKIVEVLIVLIILVAVLIFVAELRKNRETEEIPPPVTTEHGQPTAAYIPSPDEEIERFETTDENLEQDTTSPITIVQVPSTITYTPSSDQEIERFGVTGEVLEINLEQNFLKVKGNNQHIYTVVILSSTEIIKSGSKIALSGVQVGDQLSAITSENIKENVNFEAESIYIIENIPLLLGL